ncbi:MAG TPA: hypothetical protein ENK13_04915 [Thermopetrobacter sp.]|nr:hypothetical protein [Thermopetrobacter sp.]
MLKEKPPASAWDVKLARGGLIDVEFVAQVLQLIHAADHPGILRRNTGAALAALTEAGLLSAREGEELGTAWRVYQHLMHILRLCVREGFDGSEAPEGLKRLLANATQTADLRGAAARLAELQAEVAAAFTRHVGPLPEEGATD